MRKISYVMLSVLLAMVMVTFSYANTSVEAIGYGTTELQAKNDALRNAVEQAAGVKIFSETVVKDFVALQDVLITESFGFVTAYEVVSSKPKAQEQGFEVKVRATVSKNVNQEWARIRVILEQKGNPSIMFCLKESLDGQELVVPMGEFHLVQKFKNLGFKVIDRQLAQETKELQKQVAGLDQNYDGIIALAAKQGADLVVFGMLEGNFAKYVDWYDGIQGNVYSYNFRTKIVRTDTAQVIGSLSQTFQTNPKDYTTVQYSRLTAGKAGLTEIVGDRYLRPMLADMLKTWIRELQDGSELVLIVSNVKFKLRDAVLESLRSVPDLITSVSIDYYRNQRLELRIKSKLNVDDLAQRMESIKTLPLQVVELKKNWLEVRYNAAD